MSETGLQVLLVGAGRMGMRHLRGLLRVAATVVVVDPRAEALADAEREARETAATVVVRRTLDEALEDFAPDAAVLSETADGRLERVESLVARGVPALLIEKPLEQSRERARALAQAASGTKAWANHFLRGLDFFADLRSQGGPYAITLTGGAYGLACNGIHWLDLAAWLAGDGTVRFATIEDTPIASGRGPQFRDYGGCALIAYPDGSTLFLSCTAASSAPIHALIVQRERESVLFPGERRATLYRREPGSDKPAYLYGADYRSDVVEIHGPDAMADATEDWARAIATDTPSKLPTVAESLAQHELLFDILEHTGESHFPIT